MLGILSVVLTVVGAACGVGNTIIGRKQTDNKITEDVAKEVAKQLSKKD